MTIDFYDVIKITSPKMHHQNYVTKSFPFQAPTLAKSWLRFWFLGMQDF